MIACPKCGFESPDDFAFCPKCATGLAAAAMVAEERKTVTTLFCDLVSFTAMSEAADPEDVDRILGEYFARAAKVIKSHGGTVEKFIGDAVVGVFGVPAAHEDDPERAVRAALRILEALENMVRPDETPLEARCGVNTGEALVRLDVDPASGRGFLTGDAVNVAARLESAAPPGGVVVGTLAHELTSHAIEYEDLPLVKAKGKAEPLEAWLARRPFARTGLRTDGPSMTPFLGRDAELQALHETLEAAERTGTGQMVLLVGEPGIGKSRLVLEFARSLDARPAMTTWRQGRCLPYGEGVTFWALGEVIKEHAGILESDDVATVEAKLEAVLPEGEDRPWLRQRMRPLLGLKASQADRDENFAAWTRFLEVIARPRPTVVVLEDLHWAGEGMLAFVEHAVSRGLRAPLLIVATTRPELLHRHQGVLTAGEGDQRTRRLTLGALTNRETGTLVAKLLANWPGAGAGEDVVEAAGGNPLYAEQYALLLTEHGSVTRGTGDSSFRRGSPPAHGTLNAVLAARLDTLPPECKALLSDAAVLGETFWRGGVTALSGSTVGDVDTAMATLLAREFVRPVVASTIEGESEYLFWHALARDVAYAQLPRKVRARKHQAAADWIAGGAGGRGDEMAEIVAHHYTTALELARATDDADLASSLLRPAIEALGRAGDRALRLDVAAGERHLARALELAVDDGEARVRLLPKWAKLLLVTDRYREADAAFEEAAAGLLAAGEIRKAALAVCWRGDAAAIRGEPAAHLKQSAVDLLAGDGPSAELAEILGHYALSLTIQDADPQSVLDAASASVEMCRRLGLPEPAVALSTRGNARLTLGDPGGLEDCERAEVAARSQGLGIERSTICINHTGIALQTEGARAEAAALVTGLEFVSSHGLASYGANFRAALIQSRYKLGEWDECIAEICAALPELEAIEDEWDLLFLRSIQSSIFALRGEAGRAVPCLDWLMSSGRASEIGWARSYALLAAATVNAQSRRQTAALDLLEECFSRPRAVLTVLEAAPEAVRTAGTCGLELSARVVHDMERLQPGVRLPLAQLVLTTTHALVAEMQESHDAAAAGFTDAAAGWHEFSMPFEDAHALLGQGRCLVALGRAPEAAAPLAAAREIFARLGAKPALAETDEWLARVATA